MTYLHQRLSVRLWSYNGKLILGRLATIMSLYKKIKMCVCVRACVCDIYHPDFYTGKPVYFNITIRKLLATMLCSSTSEGTAAEAGEMEKDERHEHVIVAGGQFYPGTS